MNGLKGARWTTGPAEDKGPGGDRWRPVYTVVYRGVDVRRASDRGTPAAATAGGPPVHTAAADAAGVRGRYGVFRRSI